MPSDSEFATLEAIVSVMKLAVEITEAIGGEKWITISTISDFAQIASIQSTSVL